MCLLYHKSFRSNIFSFLNLEFTTELYIAVGKPVLPILISLSDMSEELFLCVKMNLCNIKVSQSFRHKTRQGERQELLLCVKVNLVILKCHNVFMHKSRQG